jgi:2-C-methyl-D-erythritol 4-phosphate cytidylyltransferase
MPTIAIIVAAGAGVRMGGDVPKALMPLAGRPMLLWTLDVVRAAAGIDEVIVVAPSGREDPVRALVSGPGAPVRVVGGGPSRAESVREGLRAAAEGTRFVVVHDAARPLADADLFAAVLGGLDGVDGAIAAAPVVDTLKSADAEGLIGGTVAREGLWAAQTPQAFHAGALRTAVATAGAAGTLAAATDCASLIEAHGGRVRLIASRAPNPKVTTPSDVAVAEALLAIRGRG